MGPLVDGGRVVILGGGPAGTSCAMALLRLASQSGRRIQVTILEGKQFAGENHYNQCVGVLSPPLPQLLEEELGQPFPMHLCREVITGYVLHAQDEKILLREEHEPSYALRRVQFDAHMVHAARQMGAQVLGARAVDLEFHDASVIIYTEGAQIEADVLVGAFGLDEGSASIFARLTPYRPPSALSSVVTKYHPTDEGMTAFGSRIHAFLPRHPHIEFGSITPKGRHLTLNIAGKDVDAPLMQAFLRMPQVRHELPPFDAAGSQENGDLNFYKGRFPSSPARSYFGDRMVMIGDAAGLVRSFKGKGVTSAVQTGIRAAKTILMAGISHQAFEAHYQFANQELLRDIPYGKLIRLLTIQMARYGMLDTVLRAAKGNDQLRNALYGAVSAHATYGRVAAEAFSLSSMLAVLRAQFSLNHNA